MKIEDIKIGDYVVIGTKYLNVGLFGFICEVLEVVTPHPDASFDGNPYPHGCLKLKLPEETGWPVPEVFIGPEDVAPPLYNDKEYINGKNATR